MNIRRTKLDGFFELTPEPYADERGFFVRLYDEQVFREQGLRTKWVQESHSHSIRGGIVRGLHIQFPPYTEGKLIRAIRGKALWVAVDLRKGSPTFGQWDSILLSEELKNSMYAEPGFAHGHISLTPCDLVIKASSYYAPGYDTGIRWDDPDLRIDWKLGDLAPFLRERDKNYPTFKEFKETYGAIDINELKQSIPEMAGKIDLARQVLFLRHSQMLINERYKRGDFRIPLHLGMGHEAIAVAVDAIMQEEDEIICSHRNMHYVLARGKNLKAELDEYYLRKEGLAGGELGSMNLADKAHGVPYSSSILGNNLSVGAGLALAKRVAGKNNVVIVQSGDGAIEEGSFYESLLFLKSHNLCCMVLVENNGYSLGTHITERRCDINLRGVAQGLGIHYEKLSGNDVFAYVQRLHELRDYCIKTRTPVCVEVMLTTLGSWYLTNDQNPRGKFVNYHSGPAPTVQMNEWPIILMNDEDPVFALIAHADKDILVQESRKMLARLQEEAA